MSDKIVPLDEQICLRCYGYWDNEYLVEHNYAINKTIEFATEEIKTAVQNSLEEMSNSRQGFSLPEWEKIRMIIIKHEELMRRILEKHFGKSFTEVKG